MAFGYGGMAPITVMATKTAASVVGKWEIISVLDHNSVTKVIKKYHILTELLHLKNLDSVIFCLRRTLHWIFHISR